MKKSLSALFSLAVLALGYNPASEACTNILVSKGASADGSCMVSYSADSHQLYGEIYFKKAADWKKGDMLDVYNWDEGHYCGQIPQVPHTYKTVGNMNEHQLIITETTFGGLNLANKSGIVDYGSMIYITLQRARTAREAIKVMDELTQAYGYPSGGESLSIADTKEVWIMEIIGKGDEKGTVWVARRVPDGYICAHANQARIHHFPLNNPENCLYSKDVISFAREKGLYKGSDADFSFCDVYCPIDFGGMRACEARAWAAFNILGGGVFNWEDETGTHTAAADDYLDFAMGYNGAHKMPLFIKPAKKVTVADIADAMRDHYDNTPMDMTVDAGAGPCRVPYRWRPMGYTVDGEKYVNERAIATQQTGFWLVGQARDWMPDAVGGILWFGVDDAATSPLVPVYTNIEQVPEYYREDNGSMIEYSATSAFWQFNKVTHFAYLMYDRVAPVIRGEIAGFQSEFEAKVAEVDAKAQKMLENGNRGQALALMTEEVDAMARKVFNRWKVLENELLVKFMDGNVKRQNEDGSFAVQVEGTTIPAHPENPAFPERWLRAIVFDNGKILKSE